MTTLGHHPVVSGGTSTPGLRLMSGVEAAVQVAIEQHGLDAEAGLRTGALFSGYPGSPLGGLDLLLERSARVRDNDLIRHVPAVNEELGGAAVWGSQLDTLIDHDLYDGVVGYWYGKAPGVDRSGDVFRHANTMGVARNGGVVAIVGDDPTAKSSTIPNDSQGTLADLSFPILAPASVAEVLELGLHAVALSRFSGLWTALKVVTDLADGFASLDVRDHVPTRVLPAISFEGVPWTYQQAPSMSNVVSVLEEGRIYYQRLEAARAYGVANGLNRVTRDHPDARLGVIVVGRAAANAQEAMSSIGLGPDVSAPVRVLTVSMPFPLDAGTLRAFASGLDEILVLEEKKPFVETAVKDALYGGPDQPSVIGKRDGEGRVVVPADGELTPDRLVPVLRSRLAPWIPAGMMTRERVALTLLPVSADPVPARVPAYCSGCPHNRSTATGDGTVVGGGVGCHSIVYLEDRHREHTILPLTPMGSEGVLWLGAAPFSRTTHMVQNLGDGTLAHSGSLAIRACVAAEASITFKILFNAAVAMTGGQEVAGQTTVPALTRELEGMGVRRIIVCADDPAKYGSHASWAPGVEVRSRDRLAESEAELAKSGGVTVLVYDQRCAAESRRLWKRGTIEEPRTRVVINQAVCEGCGDCQVKSNCLSVRSVDTPLGQKTEIHQASCNHDLSCLAGDCPSFVTIETDGLPVPEPVPLPPDDLPPPPVADVAAAFSTYQVGIGGTGVVTANRLLAGVAAHEGWAVTGLDQTGLSQKAGTVTSHLRLQRGAMPSTNVVSAQTCDVFFAFDVLSGAQPQHLARLDPARTRSMVVEGVVPTASMIGGLGARPDFGYVAERIREASAEMHTCDANDACRDLLGDDMPGNVFAIGAACQAGLLPFSLEAYETVIREQAPDAEATLAAFTWGRASVARPEALREARPFEPAPSGLRTPSPEARRTGAELLARADLSDAAREAADWRTKDLVDYQNPALASKFLDAVHRVDDLERQLGGDGTLIEAVCFGYYKLLAYKDEYEVARLHLDPGFAAHRDRSIGGTDARVMLHPPTLRALGREKKIGFGPRTWPALKALRAARRLRGTPLDPFGRGEVRRIERALVAEYETWLGQLPSLAPDQLTSAARLFRLPDEVRGYEQVKLRSVERYQQAAADLRAELGWA
jgi:indolepyruvate ferredoxin oxidoreductase